MIRRPQEVLPRQQEHEGERLMSLGIFRVWKKKDGCGDPGGMKPEGQARGKAVFWPLVVSYNYLGSFFWGAGGSGGRFWSRENRNNLERTRSNEEWWSIEIESPHSRGGQWSCGTRMSKGQRWKSKGSVRMPGGEKEPGFFEDLKWGLLAPLRLTGNCQEYRLKRSAGLKLPIEWWALSLAGTKWLKGSPNMQIFRIRTTPNFPNLWKAFSWHKMCL